MLRLMILGLVSVTIFPAWDQRPEASVPFSGRVFDASSGVDVEEARRSFSALQRGTISNAEGEFRILDVPPVLDEGFLLITHPRFHPVRVELSAVRADDSFEIGLPFRQPRDVDGSPAPAVCDLYGPVAVR